MVAKSQEYLVSYGKTGVLGRFLCASAETLRRGDRVVLQSDRGLTLGTVLCEATERQARILAAEPSGQLLRRLQPADRVAVRANRRREQQLFEAARAVAVELSMPLEILDVELSLDGKRLLLQCLVAPSCDPTGLLDRLAAAHDLQVWLENLALPKEEEAHGGCGKPDCGRGEGGCTSCGNGGCSSCGKEPVDLKPYFAHLREQMDQRRTPLL